MTAPIGFPFMANGAESIQEGYAYPTEIITAFDGTEQRISQREIPRGAIEYAVLVDEQEAGLLAALLYGHQADRWAVPLWPYAQQLTTLLGAGSAVIPYPTTAEAPFYLSAVQTGDAAPWIMLWRGPLYYEVCQIASLDTDEITIVGGTTLAYGVGTFVLPTRVCRGPAEIPLDHFSSSVSGLRFKFPYDELGA